MAYPPSREETSPGNTKIGSGAASFKPVNTVFGIRTFGDERAGWVLVLGRACYAPCYGVRGSVVAVGSEGSTAFCVKGSKMKRSLRGAAVRACSMRFLASCNPLTTSTQTVVLSASRLKI